MANTAVFGIYRDRVAAETGVDRLIEAGFRREDISALLPDNTGTKDFVHEKGTKAPEGATTGAAAGAGRGRDPWDCWPESVRWPFRASAHSSRPVRLWRHWRERVAAESSADSLALW